MSLTIRSASSRPNTTIQLTGSKSESNRALIIQSLCEGTVINNLSEAQDTVTLDRILKDLPSTVDVGPAGTAMRFLAARLSIQPGEFILTGSERMKARPIGILVDALKELGANIEYLEKDGFPPLKIRGKELEGGTISIDGSVSSQFISALCMIAPKLKNGLSLNFIGEIASKPYLDMTLQMMQEFGVQHNWASSNDLHIAAQQYQATIFTVEPDWSAASYWYEIAALSKSAEIFLPNLKENSLQGDTVVAEIFKKFGVVSQFEPDGVQLIKYPNSAYPQFVEIDCERCPDLAQTFACTMAGLGIHGKLTGLKSLRIKETDRITALITELNKFAVRGIELDNFELEIYSDPIHSPIQTLNTYEDHRMAMAFAPLILKVNELTFDEPEVVGKSYPDFWLHLSSSKVSS